MLEVLIGQLGSAGGPVILALAALSFAATAVVIVKLVQFRHMGAGRTQAARRATALWIEGEQKRALDEASLQVSPASAVALAAMQSLARHRGDRLRAQEAAVQEAVEQANGLSRHLRFLEAVVQAAPMLGLLGTVVGMISAFGELSKGGGAIDPSALATGIWAALLTTAAGLGIAIPFYFLWTWLDSRVEQERLTMESVIAALLAADAGADERRPVPGDGYGRSRPIALQPDSRAPS